MPIAPRDFTDYSRSLEHVRNASEAMTGQKVALPASLLHLPIGYTGRTSTISVSGTNVIGPKGQYKNAAGEFVYRPTRAMDFELECACIVGKPTEIGSTIAIEDAEDHIFGFVILNDWSGMSPFISLPK